MSAAASESPLLAANETCATLAEPPLGFPSNCRAWRSCRSCLQKTGCILGSSNRCQSQSESGLVANSTSDYRDAFSLNVTLPNATVSNPQGLVANQSWTFPAIETTYCPETDATCAKCKEASFYRVGGFADSRFCVGEGGCVCIFNCEVVDPLASLGECTPVAISPTSAPPLAGELHSNSTVLVVLIVPIAVVIFLTLCCVIRGRYKQRNQPPVSPSVRHPRPWRNERVEIEAVTLNLFGPNQHCEKPVTDEPRRLAGLNHVDPGAFTQLQTPTTSTSTPMPPPPRTNL